MATVTGTIMKVLPNAMYQVDVEMGGKHHEVVAHVAGKLKMYYVKMLPGDVVNLEIFPYDLSRGRIVHRQKKMKFD